MYKDHVLWTNCWVFNKIDIIFTPSCFVHCLEMILHSVPFFFRVHNVCRDKAFVYNVCTIVPLPVIRKPLEPFVASIAPYNKDILCCIHANFRNTCIVCLYVCDPSKHRAYPRDMTPCMACSRTLGMAATGGNYPIVPPFSPTIICLPPNYCI